MDFVGNQAWFAALLVIHVLGAIAGIGPAFAFGILGPLAGKSGPEGAIAVLSAMHKIERVMLVPATRFVMWISGVGLIYNRGLNHDFFSSSRAWLTVSIGIYALLLVLGETFYGPNAARLLDAAKSGDVNGIQRYSSKAKAMGPVAPLLTVVIIVLMTWKPGSGCPTLSC